MEKGFWSVLAVIKRRGLPALITFTAVISGAVAYLKVTPRLYETSARLIFDDKRVSVSELGRDLSQTSVSGSGNSALANQAELIKSERILNQALAIAETSEAGRSTITTAELSRGIRIKTIPATSILEISYQSKNPELAATYVNAVAMATIRDNTKSISTEATKVRQFLQQQLPQARAQLQAAEAAENKYRQASIIVNYDEQTKSLVQSVASLEDQQRTLATQLQDANSRGESLRQITQAKGLDRAYESVRSGQDQELQKLRAKLADQETLLIEARLRFTDSHPTVAKLLQQRDALRSLYAQQLARVAPVDTSSSNNSNLNNVAGDAISQDLTSKLITNEIERAAITDKLRVTQNNIAQLRNRLTQLPLQQQPLTALVRKREEAAASLKFLQAKFEEARIAEAQKVSNLQVIQVAQPPTEASSPKPKVVLALAGAFGLLLATGVVILLELMDNTLRDASEAEELLKLPLLGVLPRLPDRTLVLNPANRFLDNVGLVEPYRMLFKSLEFRTSELQLLVVSSTISGEGKSIVASHLAAVSAMLSRRTLIIDADLRRPVQHTIFNLPAKPGITDIVEGSISLKEAVQPTEIENLSVLTCGELHVRPSQILESPAMKRLISEAVANYDFVIIDTPPLSACADTATLAKQSEGVLMVTRPNITIKEVLQRAVSELNNNGIPIVGVVVNGMTTQTEQYYRYPVSGYQMKRIKART
ncbi:lipopolysaccharide biosynthesis [Calothrix sp. NIES-4071]|nr:lipopolysaccharide biosynthesis [Calothrix sp. NIES-4071]BAZ56372.1 lipopolysaccharide biosynthesis [Calothrix sp. NIES-4105]